MKTKAKTTATATRPRAKARSAQASPGANQIVRVTNAMNRRMLRARFDSQYTTDDNRRHWAMADAMSIDASANWMVRRTLRMRSRYEYHNNSYYAGIADTIGNYVIGTGPRLQVLTRSKRLNNQVEDAFNRWARTIKLAQTLKSMRVARLVNGEAFALLRTNPRLDNAVKLDVFEIEADQVSSPLFGMYPASYPDEFFDGVVLDKWGHPIEYHVLRQHPGAFGAFVILGYEFDKWPARLVLHDFKKIRPGQQRGIPESVPALPLFAELRRYGSAVRAAAETAADYAAVLKTTQPVDPNDDDNSERPEAMDVVDINGRMFTTLPDGYDLGQVRAEQPTTTYDSFVTCTLREICRCLNVPLMFGSMDAQQANMSSAYVVGQPFEKSIQVDRAGYDALLDHVFREWISEARLIDGLLPDDLPDEVQHQWFWPSIGTHADPAKTANARAVDLSNGGTTLPRIYAAQGLDWEAEQESGAKALGVPVEEYRRMLRERIFGISGPGTTQTPGEKPPKTEPEPSTGSESANPDESDESVEDDPGDDDQSSE